MAHLIPHAEAIHTLPQPLTEGERALMAALAQALDNDWTVYVQPYLNGQRPDLLAFSPAAGIGLFEAKDWNLGAYNIDVPQEGYRWTTRDAATGAWIEVECPLRQVQRYKLSLFKYEIPLLESGALLDRSLYSLASTFVYFHRHTGAEARAFLAPIMGEYDAVLGYDDLEPGRLRAILGVRGLHRRPRLAQWMTEHSVRERLRMAVAHPNHGQTAISSLMVKFTARQRDLLPNTPGRRRVLGVAGSGKTLIVAHKAVAAAREGKNALIVCYNITMANYLKDLTRRLAAHYGPHVHRHIQVGHYHRWFSENAAPLHPNGAGEHGAATRGGAGAHGHAPVQRIIPDEADTQPALPFAFDEDEDIDVGARRAVPLQHGPVPAQEAHALPFTTEPGLGLIQPVDVLLVDEGQDFERAWVEKLLSVCQPQHFMFMEDDRQDIYERARRRGGHLPGVHGRPYRLDESFRIPREIARLGDSFIAWARLENESGDVVTEKEVMGGLFTWNYWFNGSRERCLSAVRDDLADLISTGELRAPADSALLVCSVADGWDACDALAALKLPVQTNFEAREEHAALRQLYPGAAFGPALHALRRSYKAGFWMQGGRVKVCTIHSFKGWELSRILVYFNPDARQQAGKHALLYTAMTRSQGYLTVYNADSSLNAFGQHAIARGLMKARFDLARG